MQGDLELQEQKKHPSHKTRVSMDSSTWDEICVYCGHTDISGGGWGKLAEPCSKNLKVVQKENFWYGSYDY